MAKVFQVQAKDSVMKLNAFDAINAVQNLDLDPIFNEEYMVEFGNRNFTAVSLLPETRGSFEVSATGSIPAMLARMIYNYNTQTYLFDPTTKGNVFTMTEADLENAVFDVINLKQPGATFTDATLVPNAQLEELTLRVDANGLGTETYRFVAQLQEAFYTPYHDMVSVPCTTLSSGTISVPAAYGINSGTHNIMYVFKDNTKFKSTNIPGGNDGVFWSASTTITAPTALFTTAAPFDRVVAVLYRITPGAFPTIYYPTTARFVRGDRADVWLLTSGTAASASDGNRLLRCQSVDITIPLQRDKLQEIRRNNDLTTIYYRGINYPLRITANLTLNETTLQQWAGLQGQTLNTAALTTPVDTNNTVNLADFSAQAIVVKYYVKGNDTPLCSITMDNITVTSFSERQREGSRAERTISFTGSNITIVGTQG